MEDSKRLSSKHVCAFGCNSKGIDSNNEKEIFENIKEQLEMLKKALHRMRNFMIQNTIEFGECKILETHPFLYPIFVMQRLQSSQQKQRERVDNQLFSPNNHITENFYKYCLIKAMFERYVDAFTGTMVKITKENNQPNPLRDQQEIRKVSKEEKREEESAVDMERNLVSEHKEMKGLPGKVQKGEKGKCVKRDSADESDLKKEINRLKEELKDVMMETIEVKEMYIQLQRSFIQSEKTHRNQVSVLEEQFKEQRAEFHNALETRHEKNLEQNNKFINEKNALARELFQAKEIMRKLQNDANRKIESTVELTTTEGLMEKYGHKVTEQSIGHNKTRKKANKRKKRV